MELLVVVLLVQVHAIGQHFLDVAHFDRHIRGQMRTVHIETARVDIIEAPHPKVLDVVFEIASSHKMQRLVFLNWVDRQSNQVRSPHDVSLELDVVRSLAFKVVVDILAVHSNLFLRLRVNNVPRPDIGML